MGLAENLFQEEVYDFTTPLLVVVPEAWHKILESEKALLAKILSSVKMSVDGVTIFAAGKTSIAALTAMKPRKVLIFGATLDTEVKPYETIVIAGLPILRADALGQLDDAKKKSLWLGLKQMFGL